MAMGMSNVNDESKFSKRANFTALSVLILWLGFSISGILFIILSIINVELSFIMLLFENPIPMIVCVIMLFSSKYITHSIMDLTKNKKWTEPNKFIKHSLIQFVTALVATIFSLVIYGANYFTSYIFLDVILLFSMFMFVISIGFISLCIYYSSMEWFYSNRVDSVRNY